MLPAPIVLAPLATTWFARRLSPEDRPHAAAIKQAIDEGKPPRDVSLANPLLREVHRQQCAHHLGVQKVLGGLWALLVIGGCVGTALLLGSGQVMVGAAVFVLTVLVALLAVLIVRGRRGRLDTLEAWAIANGAVGD